MIAPPWLFPRKRSPDLEHGHEDPSRTSPAPTDTETTPPSGSSEPKPDWLKKDMSRNPIPDWELAQWAAAHDPKEGSGNEADTIHDKLNPDGSKREESPEHMMSGGS
jgi:hypothetical protein